jgi:hypothetical protein
MSDYELELCEEGQRRRDNWLLGVVAVALAGIAAPHAPRGKRPKPEHFIAPPKPSTLEVELTDGDKEQPLVTGTFSSTYERMAAIEKAVEEREAAAAYEAFRHSRDALMLAMLDEDRELSCGHPLAMANRSGQCSLCELYGDE